MSNKDTVLIIGGGITGVQASLDLAEAGARVVLVEKEPTIGGKMSVLDKNFPTLDCSVCIEAPRMSEVGQHKNIELLTLAQVEKLDGEVGNFTATIRQKSRFVQDNCTRCDDCVKACPEVRPNSFAADMSSRKAIYTPIAQSVPGAYVVDIETCLNKPPNYIPCNRCVNACGPKCIDFSQPIDKVLTRDVASVIVSTGYELMDPTLIKEYGYGSHPDILTSFELERLLTSAGPTGGEILKPSNHHHPKNALIVLCVGSRDRRFYSYCSRFCCMYSIKHVFQMIDHGVKDVTVLYMNLRAYGKGFDEFLTRTLNAGTRFIRGRPSKITPNTNGQIQVRYENTNEGKIETKDFDMVVLATAVKPPQSLPKLTQALDIKLDEDGFVKSEENRGGLLYSSRLGVYVAGCASAAKDIPDSVAEAGAGASLALAHLKSRYFPETPQVEPIANIETPRVGVFICHCGSNIAGVVDVKKVAEFAKSLPDVYHTQTQMFSCAGNTQKEIEDVIREKRLTRIVIAACSPKTHENIFKGVCVRAGLNPYLLEMSNIRNQDSWVHKEDKESAKTKAMDMVAMAVEKARRLTPLHASEQPVTQAALVIGGGVAGMAAASALAAQAYPTYLIEPEAELGGQLRFVDEIPPSGIKAHDLLEAQKKQLKETGVKVYLNTKITQIGGYVGNFYARLSNNEELKVGAIVLAMGSQRYKPTEFNYGQNDRVLTNWDLEEMFSEINPQLSTINYQPSTSIAFIGCVGSRMNGTGCSRYCCQAMIGQALRLKRDGKEVHVLYKDIRTFSRHAEELYNQACHEGVKFYQYNPEETPSQAIKFENNNLSFFDRLSGEQKNLPIDCVVLSTGLKPPEEDISSQLKVAKSQDGFLLELHPKLGPAETASGGIYLAGSVQAPKDVREAVAQALAAAAKASVLLSRSHIEKAPLTAKVDLDKCKGCMACVKVCPFSAIEQVGKVKEGKVKIIEAACMGCGTCAAQCNFNAITMPYFTREQILSQIDAALAEKPNEKVIVFTCNWCSYAGADQAGIEKIQYPSSSRILRTMCSARIEQAFVNRAFEKGAGAVLLTGCHLTEKGSDCHYNWANKNTLKRFQTWKAQYERKGIAPERFQLQWISASEGKEFAAKMKEMDAVVKNVVRSASSVARS